MTQAARAARRDAKGTKIVFVPFFVFASYSVVAGLVPAIHVLARQVVDARNKAGHDDLDS